MLVAHVLADGVFIVLDAVPAAEANLTEFHRDAAGGTVCVPCEDRPEPDLDVVLGFGHGVTDRESNWKDPRVVTGSLATTTPLT